MTEFVFESNDGSKWTEEEKLIAIARHEAIEKMAKERFEKSRADLLMKLIFKQNESGVNLIKDK